MNDSVDIYGFNSHPLNGWFGLAKDCDVTIIGKGVRHSDFKQKWAGGNGHSIEVSGRTNTKN